MKAPTQTFVGPVFKIDRTKKSWSFYVLQGTSTLQLDYDDHATAQQNRASICDALYTHQVRSNSLLQAIQKAINDVLNDPKTQGHDGYERGLPPLSPDESGDAT